MKTLRMRFGRPDQVITNLIAKAKDLPPPVGDNMDSLVEFGTAVENLVGTMESLEYTGHMNNPQLINDLLRKLPTHLRLQWGTK